MLKKVLIKCCLLIIFLVSAKDIFAQSCVQCGERILRINDLIVKVPGLEEIEEVKKLGVLVKLFFYVINQQAGASCFDCQQASQSDVGYGQYQISGLITGVVGKYSLDLTLVATKDNALLASGTSQFTENETTDAPISNAYASLTSGKNLYDIIYTYEKKRRDADTKYAIQPRIKLLIPGTNLKLGDAMMVEVEMLDCDKEPLKNRKISFEKPSLGTLDKYEVTTNDRGKAILVFTAPKRSGSSSIKAKYEFTYASGMEGGREENSVYLVIGDPDAPPFIAFDCDAGKRLPEAEKWAKKQWPVYLYNKRPDNHGYLGFWKTYKPGVYSKEGSPDAMKLIRDEAIKIADEEIDKMKDIFQKYKADPQYCFALNYLLKFSYDLYHDALEKEPKWDIKKDAAEFNMQFADSYLKKVRDDHKYSVANFVMYFINEYKVFKEEDKIAEYDSKLQNALKFSFKLTGSYNRHTANGDITTNYDYDRPIDCWNHTSIEDQITVSYTETNSSNPGNNYSNKERVPLQFAWDLKICKDDDSNEDFTPVPLVPPGTKPKIQFVINWFTFPGGGYIPFDIGPLSGSMAQSTTFPFPDLTAQKTFTYSQINSQDGDTETFLITIHLTHAPQ